MGLQICFLQEMLLMRRPLNQSFFSPPQDVDDTCGHLHLSLKRELLIHDLYDIEFILSKYTIKQFSEHSENGATIIIHDPMKKPCTY